MYLKKHKRKKNGKYNTYYSIAEKRKVSGGRYVEKMVLYLGEISDSQKKSWEKSIEIINEDNKPVRKSLFAYDQDNQTHHDVDTIPVKLSKMKLENPRTFGDCWLGCEIWDMLGLDKFWSERIDSPKSPVEYSKVVKLLAVNRLIKPGAEFYVHQHWFSQTAMDVLLDCDFEVAEKNRLYRCLDRILPYKEELCSYLKDTWQMMFNLEYDILLYDVTSTYFEGLCKQNSKAQFGHSKDRRSDCRQILIALVVTPDGFPINYEILAGNTSEKTTLKPLLNKIESKYGKAGRVWLMDRGIPTEAVLAYMSYCLQVTLRHRLRANACGLTSQAALETMSRIQMLDVSFETHDGRTLLMQRYTEPQVDQKLLLYHLKMDLPPQKPPKIYRDQLKK